MMVKGREYCVLMRGQHDCKSQDYWSRYAIEKWGEDVDPYWTTSFNDEKNILEDVLYVRKDIRFKEAII